MRTVEFDKAIGHPDLASDRAALEQGRSNLHGQWQPAIELAQMNSHEDAPPDSSHGTRLAPAAGQRDLPRPVRVGAGVAEAIRKAFDLPEP